LVLGTDLSDFDLITVLRLGVDVRVIGQNIFLYDMKIALP
jgi:hypothetical protein